MPFIKKLEDHPDAPLVRPRHELLEDGMHRPVIVEVHAGPRREEDQVKWTMVGHVFQILQVLLILKNLRVDKPHQDLWMIGIRHPGEVMDLDAVSGYSRNRTEQHSNQKDFLHKGHRSCSTRSSTQMPLCIG